MPRTARGFEALHRLRREIDAERDPHSRRKRILALLQPGAGWAQLGAGMEALAAHVDVPDNEERTALREVVARCEVQGAPDQSMLLRTTAVRLLARDPEREDLELFAGATRSYKTVDGIDVAAELRGIGLLAVSRLDADRARWLAAKCLFDGPVPNEEPHRTAVRILIGAGDLTLLRHWLDTGAILVRPEEVVAEAEGTLAATMPAQEWALRAASQLGAERPLETLAAIDSIVGTPRPELAPTLRAMLRQVTNPDLFRAIGLTLAAARDPVFSDLLLDMVDEVPHDLLDAYTDAVALARSSRKDQVLQRINERARKRI